MKFAWLLIFTNTIVSAAEISENDSPVTTIRSLPEIESDYGHLVDIEETEQELIKTTNKQSAESQPALLKATETVSLSYSFLSSTATLLSYSPHLIPLIVGIKSFNSKDPALKKMFTKICLAYFLGYYRGFFNNENSTYNPPPSIQQHIYYYATLCGGLSCFLPFEQYALSTLSIGFKLFKNFH